MSSMHLKGKWREFENSSQRLGMFMANTGQVGHIRQMLERTTGWVNTLRPGIGQMMAMRNEEQNASKIEFKEELFSGPYYNIAVKKPVQKKDGSHRRKLEIIFPGKSSIKLCLCSQVLTIGLLREPSHFWVIYVVKPSKGVPRGSVRRMETLQVPKRSCVRVHSRLWACWNSSGRWSS